MTHRTDKEVFEEEERNLKYKLRKFWIYQASRDFNLYNVDRSHIIGFKEGERVFICWSRQKNKILCIFQWPGTHLTYRIYSLYSPKYVLVYVMQVTESHTLNRLREIVAYPEY